MTQKKNEGYSKTTRFIAAVEILELLYNPSFGTGPLIRGGTGDNMYVVASCETEKN